MKACESVSYERFVRYEVVEEDEQKVGFWERGVVRKGGCGGRKEVWWGKEVWWQEGGVVAGRRCGGRKEVWWQEGGVVAGRRCGGRKEVWWGKEVWW